MGLETSVGLTSVPKESEDSLKGPFRGRLEAPFRECLGNVKGAFSLRSGNALGN